ncbi:MAG: hypothetical protein HYY93_11635 [Planctomycetes bacterium]|nr:hypothetical protein [Planctomycetota bacterium]
MFDKFTDRARKVMSLARQEAQKFNHEYIGTEHILLGLVHEESGIAAKVLKNLGADLRKIRMEVEKIIPEGPPGATMAQLPFTPRAKRVLELAREEANGLGHDYVGSEHLLLGLLKESEGIASHVLMNLNLKMEDVREEVLDILGGPSEAGSEDRPGSRAPSDKDIGAILAEIENLTRGRDTAKTPPPASDGLSDALRNELRDAFRFDRFTARAKRVMSLAQEEARSLNHEYIGTEHILLGIAASPESTAAALLLKLGASLDRVRTETLKLLPQGPPLPTAGERPYTPRAKRVLKLAEEEAEQHGRRYVGTEHLLLALVRETEGLAAQVLLGFGVDVDWVRTEAFEALSTDPSKPEPSPDRPARRPPRRSVEQRYRTTPRIRSLLARAREEAALHGDDYIDIEHLLLGLLNESEDVVARLMNAIAMRKGELRRELERALARRPPPPAAENKATQSGMDEFGAREILNYGVRVKELGAEIDRLRRRKEDFISARDYESAARVRDEEVQAREKVERLDRDLPTGVAGDGPGPVRRREDLLASLGRESERLTVRMRQYETLLKLSEPALRALATARAEAGRLGHPETGSEHLLLALAGDAESQTSQILREAGAEADAVRREVAPSWPEESSATPGAASESIPPKSVGTGTPSEGTTPSNRSAGSSVPTGHGLPTFSRWVWDIVDFARNKADDFRHEQVTAEHLLLGILWTSDSLAAQVLSRMRVDPAKVQESIFARLGVAGQEGESGK